MISLRCIAVSAALASVALGATASAQVRYRRPFPSDTAPITAHFDTNGPGGGLADYVCGGRTYDGHTGTDFGIPVGTPVVAAAAGRVISVMTGCPDVGYNCSPCGGLCGNQVRVRHGDGTETLYCHMQSGGMRVTVGTDVGCGQTLGHSASSGCSTGPHLHFGFHASAAAYADDPFSGACGGPVSMWNNQRGYPSTPGGECQCMASAETCNNVDDDCDGRTDEGVVRDCSTACGTGTESCSAGGWAACTARVPVAESCNGSDDDCDAATDEGDLCEIDLLHDQPSAYAGTRSTDVNGDGRADVCARGGSGVRCWPASETGWSEEWAPIPLSDANGWADVTNYATLRMGDLNGDGRADLCARSDSAIECALSTGTGFGELSVWRDGLSDVNGWSNPQYYTTLRLADVDGDGRDDLCARDSQGFGCWISNGTIFDRRVEGPRWGDDGGWNAAKQYGTLRMGDLNGDRRADVCGRSTTGVECWLSSGDAFPTAVDGPDWSGGNWGERSLWSTIRLLDYDGDGRGDLCARVDNELTCVPSTGTGFGAPVVAFTLGDGWDDPSNFGTIRTGDIDGNGTEDLCLRSNTEVFCLAWDGTSFARIDGPAWSDENGWSAPAHFQTMRLADFDGDGTDDLCARAAASWFCQSSTGTGFATSVDLGELTNEGGWAEHRYWSTIMSAGRACRSEMEACNGRDDDCDGEIDEHAAAEICNDTDDDCDGEVDEDLTCSGPDGSVRLPDGGYTTPPRGSEVSGGCACVATGAGRSAPPIGLLMIGAVMIATRARRARRMRGRSCQP